MTVNEAWQGRRFKTKAYNKYQTDLLFMLPKIVIPSGKLHIIIEYGFSNKLCDVDNPNKQFIDVLSKKYGFNDNMVYKLEAEKVDVKKGQEYIKFKIIEYANPC